MLTPSANGSRGKALAYSAILLGALGVFVPTAQGGRTLTFEERVEAQRAIEQVYYAHQVGATQPFELAVSDIVLEQKVHDYLAKSAALTKFWNTPVTAEMLSREVDRIARQSRLGQRLGELFVALGNDPFLIQECLARPVLVDRLTWSFFTQDRSIHAGARRRAEVLRGSIASHRIDPRSEHPLRTVTEVPITENGSELGAAKRNDRQAKPFAPLRTSFGSDLPSAPGGVGRLAEHRDGFVVPVLLGESEHAKRVATYWIPKRSWHEWWREAARHLATDAVPAVALDIVLLPEPTPGRAVALGDSGPCLPDDVWENGRLDDVPTTRLGHSAIWTGTRMIVWGGFNRTTALGNGSLYDPATDSWTSMSGVNAPEPRLDYSAVWTGQEFIVWGGLDLEDRVFISGGRYDPITDTWTAMSEANAPEGREGSHSTVWTGREMIVWGGNRVGGLPPYTLDTGGRYDPQTDTWKTMSSQGAPSARKQHRAVWTGSEMIAWGGWDVVDVYDTGARYNPDTDTWEPMSQTGAPTARVNFTAVWTGNEMLVWGGVGLEGYFGDGGRYDPVRDVWSPVSTVDAPAGRIFHTMLWTGEEAIVWGGKDANEYFGDGGRYSLASDTWTPVSVSDAPEERIGHFAAWTDDRMVVWGGESPGQSLQSGGQYDPHTNTWTPTSIGDAPPGGVVSSAVWTGSLMLVWGGGHEYWIAGFSVSLTRPLYIGSRYDPVLERWTPMAADDSPTFREDLETVWTGKEMIVWGGRTYDGQTYPESGSRYDPIADRWTRMSTVDAPKGRINSAAVWTGDEMIVWGGRFWDPQDSSVSGGRYDPIADRWTPTSTVNAPLDRQWPSVVWAGTEMIVWGGRQGVNFLNTGGRYNPSIDSWAPTSLQGAPVPRRFHKAVWTGDVMVVWGGRGSASSAYYNTGGRYDPVTDSWTPTTTHGAPQGRYSHASLWTGDRLLVWGGAAADGLNFRVNSGGLYDPIDDVWTPTSLVEAPMPRDAHVAVWAGDSMIVWSGSYVPFRAPTPRSGGRYLLGQTSDDDGDGFTECDGDCNDDHSGVYPGALETCNGFDDDCDGLADLGFTDVDSDYWADCIDNCPEQVNPDQSDWDTDGIGDVCETGAALADIDHSGRVDGYDLLLLARAFGTSMARIKPHDYDADVDLDRSWSVDGIDLAILAVEFGKLVDSP